MNSDPIDVNALRAELARLDADALFARTKQIIRDGASADDWASREIVALEWQRRGNGRRYNDAYAVALREADEEREARLRACAETINQRFKQREAT